MELFRFRVASAASGAKHQVGCLAGPGASQGSDRCRVADGATPQDCVEGDDHKVCGDEEAQRLTVALDARKGGRRRQNDSG